MVTSIELQIIEENLKHRERGTVGWLDSAVRPLPHMLLERLAMSLGVDPAVYQLGPCDYFARCTMLRLSNTHTKEDRSGLMIFAEFARENDDVLVGIKPSGVTVMSCRPDLDRIWDFDFPLVAAHLYAGLDHSDFVDMPI
jgi:hypothetical protein